MTTQRSLVAHLDAHLGTDRGFFTPFRVHYFDAFPAEFYRFALSAMPPRDQYRDLPHEDAMRPDGTSTRKVLALDKSAPAFWCDLGAILCSTEVEEIFRRHVGFAGPVRPIARLLRDFAGYRIAPHPDSKKKACTVQIYLPADESQVALGTSFYSRRDDDGSFVEARKLPFLPNTGYCFKVTDASWHGADFPPFTKPRDSLIITYYKS